MMTSGAICTRGVKYRIAMAQTAFNKKKNFFHEQIGLNFKEETSKVLYLEYVVLWC
jgi:hypothetical protein